MDVAIAGEKWLIFATPFCDQIYYRSLQLQATSIIHVLRLKLRSYRKVRLKINASLGVHPRITNDIMDHMLASV